MTRVVAPLFLVFTCVSTNACHLLAQQVESSGFAQLYRESLVAEQQLVEAQLKNEEQRLEVLNTLRENGDVSWLRWRTQRLNVDRLKARFSETSNLVTAIHQWSRPIGPMNDFAELHLGRVPFTNLFVESQSPSERLAAIDFEKLVEICQADLSKRVISRDVLKKKTKSLDSDHIWKVGFSSRLRVADCEVKALACRLRVLKHLANDGQTNRSEDASKRHGLEAKSSILTQTHDASLALCQAHEHLTEHLFKLENKQLAALKHTETPTLVHRQSVETSNRVSTLETMRESQNAVSSFLRSLKNPDRKPQLFSPKQSSSLSSWSQIRICYCQAAATFQLRSAKLDREMYREIISRLSQLQQNRMKVASENLTFVKSLKEIERAELEKYHQRLARSELTIKLAQANLNTLAQQLTNGIVVLSLNGAQPTSVLTDGSTYSLPIPNGSTSTPTTLVDQPVKRWGEILASVECDSFATFPVRFLDDDFDSRRLNLQVLLSQGTAERHQPETHADLKASNENDRTLARRLLPTLDRAFENGVHRSSRLSWQRSYGTREYLGRRLLPSLDRTNQLNSFRTEIHSFPFVGDVPWDIPGPQDFGESRSSSEFRRKLQARRNKEFIGSEFYDDSSRR